MSKAALVGFREAFYGCLTGWGDALFELCDAALCAPAPVPGQVTELANLGRRHEARPNETVLEELRDPLGVFDVGLAPRHGLR